MTTEKVAPQIPPATDDAYDPPRVERTLSPDELEREVQYAGQVISGRAG